MAVSDERCDVDTGTHPGFVGDFRPWTHLERAREELEREHPEREEPELEERASWG